MALSRDVVIRMLGDSASAEKAMRAAAAEAEVSVSAYRRLEREHARQQAAVESSAAAQRDAMSSVGKAALTMGAVVAAGLAVSTKAAVDWESAWAGVSKTVDGTPEQMNQLEASLRGLATTLPATHDEIAGVAEAAGQLGIARGDIVEFTKVAIALGVSTNLSAEDAATGLARLSNIMGTSSSDVDRMGSSLVALGNAGASTEGEILDMALRIGAAGRQAGMTEGEVLALANSMSSLGIEAEAGGTAISTVIKDINSAVMDGGDQLDLYAEVAGTTATKFAAAWRDDAAGALVTVVEGLAQMQAQGQNVNTVISELGLDGIRVSDTLLRLSGDTDGLTASLALGNSSWAENNALMNEANKRYETTASKVQIAQNTLNDAAITIGSTLLPVLASGAGLIADFARGFAELPGWMQDTVVILGAVAAVIGVVGGAALVAMPKLLAFRTEMTLLSTGGGAATSALGKFGLFMTGPWGAAIGIGVGLLGGLITMLGKSSQASEEAAGYQHDLASALRESNGVIDDSIRAMAAQKAEDSKFKDSSLLEWAEKVGVAGSKVTDALLGNKDAYSEITTAIDAYAQAQLDAAVAGGYADTLDLSWVGELKGQYEGLANGMGGAVSENERLAEATAASGDAAEGAAPQVAGAAAAIAGMGEDTGDAADAIQDLIDALDAMNGPTLDVRESTRQYQEALAEVTQAITENGTTLDVTTEAGRKNQEMLDGIAKAAGDQATAILNSTGSYDQFRGSLEGARQTLFDTALQFYGNEDAAWAYVNSVLAIPSQAETQIDLPTYGLVTGQLATVQSMIRGIPPQTWTNVGVIDRPAIDALESVGIKTRTLPDGTVEVYADTAQAEADLRALTATRTVRVVAQAVSNLLPFASVNRAAGGVVHGPGTATSDSIPAMLSDGEFVVKAAATARNRGLLEDINSGRIRAYATGGYVQAEDGSFVPSSFYGDQLPPGTKIYLKAEDGSFVPSSFYDDTSDAVADGVEEGMAALQKKAGLDPASLKRGLDSTTAAVADGIRDGMNDVVKEFSAVLDSLRIGDQVAKLSDLDSVEPTSSDPNNPFSNYRMLYDATQRYTQGGLDLPVNFKTPAVGEVYNKYGNVLPEGYMLHPVDGSLVPIGWHGQIDGARATGGPVGPGTWLVGEKGPELIRLGDAGYVTPAEQTAQIRAALQQPGPGGAALTALAAQSTGGAMSSSTTSYARTFAPVFQVVNAEPMTARQLMDLARDEEYLHG